MAAWWARPRSPDGARTQARRTNPWPTASDARATASDRELASSLLYTAWAWLFTVFVETWRCSPISRTERCVGRNRRIRSSAIVSDPGPASADALSSSISAQASSNQV
jgi:hypothetical protein